MMLISLLLAVTAHAPSCQTPSVPAAHGEPIHVPIELANNHVYVIVCAGNRQHSFILDTGAGQTFFDLGLARAAGMNTHNPFTARGAGAGTVEGASIDRGEVRLAGTDVSVAVPLAIDLSALPAREGHAMDGILGYDFLNRYVVAIDYLVGELRLYDRASYKYQGTGSVLPITFINNHPHVDAEFRLADGGTVRGRFIVDVGAAASLSLTKQVVDANHLRDRIGPTIRKPSGGGVGGPATSDIGRVASLKFGDSELKSPVTFLYGDSAGVFTDNSNAWIGNIGGEVLRRFTVILDYRDKQLILEPNAALGEPFETDMTGAAIVGAGDLTHLVVDYVLADSPAAAAGLVPGDSVVAIEGAAITATSLGEWRRRAKREGEQFTVMIKRGAETRTITFRTRRIV